MNNTYTSRILLVSLLVISLNSIVSAKTKIVTATVYLGWATPGIKVGSVNYYRDETDVSITYGLSCTNTGNNECAYPGWMVTEQNSNRSTNPIIPGDIFGYVRDQVDNYSNYVNTATVQGVVVSWSYDSETQNASISYTVEE